MKVCSKCNKELPLSDFYWHKQNNLYRPDCKKCNNKAVRDRHNRNKEKHIDYNRRYYMDNKEKIIDRINKRKQEKPEAVRAKWTVENAKRSGKLKKPSTCSICHQRRILDAHHDDYNKPLEIRWLCRQCHMLLHSGVINE